MTVGAIKGYWRRPPRVKSEYFEASTDVRFTPESGHLQCTSRCPLRANSGHQCSPLTAPLGVKAGCFSIFGIEPISLTQRCAERDQTCKFGAECGKSSLSRGPFEHRKW